MVWLRGSPAEGCGCSSHSPEAPSLQFQESQGTSTGVTPPGVTPPCRLRNHQSQINHQESSVIADSGFTRHKLHSILLPLLLPRTHVCSGCIAEQQTNQHLSGCTELQQPGCAGSAHVHECAHFLISDWEALPLPYGLFSSAPSKEDGEMLFSNALQAAF